MATFDQVGPGNGAQPKRTVANTANWAGAVVSLALIGGVGVWGFKLVMRDVSGIPVVQATEGPMRLAPNDPGGESADHQGLSVNDVAGTGIAANPADTLTLAPRPVDLSGEDLALGDIVAPDPVRPSDSVAARDGANASDQPLTEEMTLSDTLAPTPAPAPPVSDDPIQALADQIAANIEPIFTSDVALEVEDEETGFADEIEAVDVAASFDGGVARSLRPQTRPGDLRTASLAPMVATANVQTAELDPDTLPEGTRLVQLGAYDSPEVARTEWARLEGRFGDYLDGKSRVIERATSGGRVFYRLRAHGFADISDARRFCAAFVAENADCIPVVSR